MLAFVITNLQTLPVISNQFAVKNKKANLHIANWLITIIFFKEQLVSISNNIIFPYHIQTNRLGWRITSNLIATPFQQFGHTPEISHLAFCR